MEMLEGYQYYQEILGWMNERQVLISQPLKINCIGGRKSGKTFAAVQFITRAVLLPDLKPKEVDVVAIRQSSKDAKKTFKEIKGFLDMEGIPYTTNETDRRIMVNNQQIEVWHTNTKTKSDKASNSGVDTRLKARYMIVWFEEAYQFRLNEMLATQESIRGIKDNILGVINIKTCNPWTLGNEYIKYVNDKVPINTQELRKTGDVFKIVDNEIFHLTNWRIARNTLTLSDINMILETNEFDSERAKVVDWGWAGIEGGLIYAHQVKKIRHCHRLNTEIIAGGVDWGWGTSPTASKTTAYLGGYDKGCIMVKYEYTQENRNKYECTINGQKPREFQRYKDERTKVTEIVAFYNQIVQDDKSLHRLYRTGLNIYVDNSEVMAIQILNEEARARNYNWMHFKASDKFPTNDRVEVMRAYMGLGRVYVDKENCPYLMKEFNMASWDENKTKQERTHEYTHALTAIEYMLGAYIYKLMQMIPEIYIPRKTEHENTIQNMIQLSKREKTK